MNSKRSWENMLTRVALRLYILAMIKHQPTYGYNLISLLQKKFSDDVSITRYHVYPILQEFTQKKIVQFEWQTYLDRPRKYYRLTPKGEITFTKIILELMKIVEGAEQILRKPVDALDMTINKYE